MGRVNSAQSANPDETACRSPSGLFSALLLEISRETHKGIPPVPIVRNTEKTDKETWYKPKPSAPSRRESTIRYKNPSPRSATESAVTIDAVASSMPECGSVACAVLP